MNDENQTIAPSTGTPVQPAVPVQPVPVEQPVMMQPEAVPATAQPKSGKKLVGPIIAGVVVLLLIVGAFVAKAMLSTPKAVFKAAIDNVSKEMNAVIEDIDEKFNIGEKAVEVGLTTKVESNMEDLKEAKLDKIEFNARMGVDVKNKEALLEGGIKGSSEKVNATVFVKEGYTYLKTSFYDKVIKLVEMADIDFDELKDIFDEIDKTEVDPQLYNRIVEAYANALSDSLDKEAMDKESVNIKIAGKKYKVTKNSYKLGEKQQRKLATGVINNLLKDKNFVKDLAKASGESEEDIKKALEEAKAEAEKIKSESTITMNLYSKGLLKTEIVGFELKSDKESEITWYAIDGNVEINVGKEARFVLEKGKKESKAKVEVMGQTVLEADVRALESDKIDLDFEVKMGETAIEGTIYFTSKETKNSVSGDYKFKIGYDKEYVQVSGTYSIESKDKLDGLNVNDAINEKDVDMEKFSKDLEAVISKDETLSGMVKTIENYFNALYGNTTCPECDQYDTEDPWGGNEDYTLDKEEYGF